MSLFCTCRLLFAIRQTLTTPTYRIVVSVKHRCRWQSRSASPSAAAGRDRRSAAVIRCAAVTVNRRQVTAHCGLSTTLSALLLAADTAAESETLPVLNVSHSLLQRLRIAALLSPFRYPAGSTCLCC